MILARVCAILLIALLSLLSINPQTSAAFPGENGKIAWAEGPWDLVKNMTEEELEQFDVNPGLLYNLYGLFNSSINGQSTEELAQRGLFWSAPRYSADGKKLTATGLITDNVDDYSSAPSFISIMNSDGSSLYNVDLSSSPHKSKNSHLAQFSNFDNTGQMITFAENWRSSEVNNASAGVISKARLDGSQLEQLTETSEEKCDTYPVWSPDGSKIAFYRGDSVNSSSGIYIMNSDGSDQRELVRLASEADCGIFLLNSVISSPEVAPFMELMGYGSPYMSTFDWSPDGTKIVYSQPSGKETDSPASQIKEVGLDGDSRVVKSEASTVVEDEDGSSFTVKNAIQPQYTPEGQIIFKYKELEFSSDGALQPDEILQEELTSLRMSTELRMISADGADLATIFSRELNLDAPPVFEDISAPENREVFFEFFGQAFAYTLASVQPVFPTEPATPGPPSAGTLSSTLITLLILLLLLLVWGALLVLRGRAPDPARRNL